MERVKALYLAHSSQDKEFARRLAVDASVRGVPVWFDEWEIKVGDSIIDKISRGIDGSGWLAICLSVASVQSEWVKRELNAALMREVDQKIVAVLPLRLDDADMPALLREKRYADFRESYERGLEELMRTLIPEGASSTLLRSVPELRLHYSPAVRHGRLVTAFDLNRVVFAINAAEHALRLIQSDLPLFRKGQRVGFSHINGLLPSIDRLRTQCGLKTEWRLHPVAGGQMYTEGHMNELYGGLNEVLDAVLDRQGADA